MPTVLRDGPYRFFFYSSDLNEPEHIHVERGSSVAKLWLSPVRLESSRGFDRRELRTVHRIVERHESELVEAWHGYSTVEIDVPDATGVEVSDDAITLNLSDARSISVPLTWYPRLLQATDEESRKWRLVGNGEGIHWDELDEDISVEGLLAGRRSGESQASFQGWLDSRSLK